MFYGGKLKAMPAKLLSDDGENIVIRPLAYCMESDIKAYAEAKAFPIIPVYRYWFGPTKDKPTKKKSD